MFKYWALNRPPIYAARPEGQAAFDVWLPMRSIPNPEASRSIGERHCFGWVEYEQQLSKETVWKWELLPADRKERCEYLAWYRADRDQLEAEYRLGDYIDLGEERLREIVDEDYSGFADLALELYEIGDQNG